MGGRGSSSGLGGGSGAGVSESESVKKEFINSGLNSRFKGVKRDAEQGTGNYSYKNAKAIGDKDVNKMQDIKFHEKNGKTLAEGRIGQKSVVYGNKTNSKQIKDLKEKVAKAREKVAKEAKASERPEIRTTSTYDRWKKRNDKNFAAWFGMK